MKLSVRELNQIVASFAEPPAQVYARVVEQEAIIKDLCDAAARADAEMVRLRIERDDARLAHADLQQQATDDVQTRGEGWVDSRAPRTAQGGATPQPKVTTPGPPQTDLRTPLSVHEQVRGAR